MDLLARSSDDVTIKVIFGVIIAVIWIISAIASSLNKKAQEIRRRTQYGQLPSDLSPRGYAASGPAPTYGGRPGYPVPPPPPPAQKKRKNRGGGGAGSLAASAAPALASTGSLGAAATQAAATATAAAPSSATARPSRIARLARRPDTLRAAFILSEVLSPPKSLRNESGQQL